MAGASGARAVRHDAGGQARGAVAADGGSIGGANGSRERDCDRDRDAIRSTTVLRESEEGVTVTVPPMGRPPHSFLTVPAIAALPAVEHVVQLVHADGGARVGGEWKRDMRRTFTTQELASERVRKWLAFMNLHGFNVLWRPVGPHVVVDLDGMPPGEARERSAALGVRMSVLAETSPGNSQAWVTLVHGRWPVDEALERVAQRMLTEWFGGDRGATGVHRLGRLPGFANRKLTHQRPDGSFPVVGTRIAPMTRVCHQTHDAAQARLAEQGTEAGGERADAAADDDLGDITIMSRGVVVGVMHAPADDADLWQSWPVRPVMKADGKHDRSATDARRVTSMLRAGMPEAAVRAAMLAGSEKVRERRSRGGDEAARRMVEQTVAGAVAAVMRE